MKGLLHDLNTNILGYTNTGRKEKAKEERKLLVSRFENESMHGSEDEGKLS